MERARVFRIGGSTIDELKVFNSVLSATQIANLASLSSGPSEQFEEAESLDILSSDGTDNRSHTNASGGYHIQAYADAIGDWVEFSVNVAEAGTYDLVVGVRKRFNCGIWQLSTGGRDIGPPVDLYSSGQSWSEIVFGTATLDVGSHTLRFEVTGKNASATNYSGYFDTIILSPATVVIDVDPYDTWASTIDWGTTDVSLRNPQDDPDGDGTKNLFEMIFGQNPLGADLVKYPLHDFLQHGDGSTTITLSYPKSDPSSVVELQWSPNLAGESWTTVNVGGETYDPGSGLYSQGITAPTGTTKFFVRLKAD